VNKASVYDHSNESSRAVILYGTFITLRRLVVVTFESVDETPECDQSNESYRPVDSLFY